MKLSAIITKAELRSLAHSLVPLRIDLSSGPDADQRWLDIDELLDSELETEEGLELAVRASIRWPERSILTEFRIERVGVLVSPWLVSTEHGSGLVIALRCREIDIRWVPDFIDRAIVRRVNAKLADAGAEFRWDFSDTLTFSFTETAKNSNIERIGFEVRTAELSVEAKAIRIEGPMQVRIDRRSPAELELELEEGEALPALPNGEDESA